MGDEAMKKLTLRLAPALTALFIAGPLPAPPALAQAAPQTTPLPGPAVKQRAPGVPIAPQPNAVSRLRTEERGLWNRDRRVARDERAAPQPDRDPPMPRGVPSIIAP